MKRTLIVLLTFIACLTLGTGAAQAVVVDVNAIGQNFVQTDTSGAPYVSYPTDQANYIGVAMVPGSRSSLATAGVPYVATSGQCEDPNLPSGLIFPSTGLCYHGGSVMHANETFALTWDPLGRYWAGTESYVDQFLSDVASGSGTLTSPYAVTTQYTDSTGRAGNLSLYGGSCVDAGSAQNTTCQFGSSSPNGVGYDYPSNGCTPGGSSYVGSTGGTNDTCLTDAQIRTEVETQVAQMGILSQTHSGYTPLVVVLLPPQTEVCLDAAGSLCSANSNATAQFCSYHATVPVNTPSGPATVAYLVQPWTAKTSCDEPDAPAIPSNPDPATLAQDVGIRLVSPLSQAQIASIVNPDLDAWFALDGSEVNDNDGCVPEAGGVDKETVGTSSQNPYLLQGEFSNSGVIVASHGSGSQSVCITNVLLTPSFAVPGGVHQNDVVEFDGSTSTSTLIIPNSGYQWSFGDGATGVGPSVSHAYSKPGHYQVTLTVTDLGGNVRSLTETIDVLATKSKGGGGGGGGSGGGGGGSGGSSHLHVQVQLLPQSFSSALHQGIALRLTSNEAADGFATLMIGRDAARRAHIHTGKGAMVVIGRGTVSGIKQGTAEFHVHLSAGLAKKLAGLQNVTLTLQLALFGADGSQTTIDAAGHY